MAVRRSRRPHRYFQHGHLPHHAPGRRPPELAERHPWLPAAALKAFERCDALARLGDTSATKVTLPFVEEQLRAARALMGRDFWSYGVSANRHVLETFLRHHHGQGLSSRVVAVEELFHPSTLETHRI
jgi:4,5-dihydroxyphthalate decarboxylase